MDCRRGWGTWSSSEVRGHPGIGSLVRPPDVVHGPMSPRASAIDLAAYEAGVLAGDRALLGRAITLVESGNPHHQALARRLLQRLLPHGGQALRVGISGVPGSGKSSLIDALGVKLLERGQRVAVLAVDPSSRVSKGSILGDKTRMQRLAADARAFVRPSPTAGTLGGVSRKTRETMAVCEAAGFDVLLVETVGVGQSEVLVSEMTDCFLVLMLAGAGDELQGIKRGILELADLLAVNKADGENLRAAQQARAEYEGALHLMRPANADWVPPVLCVSALSGAGLDELWAQIERFQRQAQASGAFEARRRSQRLQWMWSTVEDQLMADLRRDPAVAGCLPALERDVLDGRATPGLAASTILAAFGQGDGD